MISKIGLEKSNKSCEGQIFRKGVPGGTYLHTIFGSMNPQESDRATHPQPSVNTA